MSSLEVLHAVASGVPWFPQEYAEAFNIVKGCIAIVGVLMLVGHMDRVWRHEALTPGRRARYIALLLGAMTVAYSSAEQLDQDAVVNYRNLGAMLFVLVTFVAAVLSIRESRNEP